MEKYSGKQTSSKDFFQVEDRELESTLEKYLHTNENDKERPKLVNLVTISGFAFLVVGFLAVMQSVFSIGPQLDTLIRLLPLIGGVLVVLIGMGIFSSEKKPRKLNERNKTVFPSFKSASSTDDLDEFALLQSKKLTRSSSDSRFLGVCGGVAKYLGFDSTLVRIAFIASVFFGYGTPILLYFALGVILPKEPKQPF